MVQAEQVWPPMDAVKPTGSSPAIPTQLLRFAQYLKQGSVGVWGHGLLCWTTGHFFFLDSKTYPKRSSFLHPIPLTSGKRLISMILLAQLSFLFSKPMPFSQGLISTCLPSAATHLCSLIHYCSEHGLQTSGSRSSVCYWLTVRYN